jgi:hypothetical protein
VVSAARARPLWIAASIPLGVVAHPILLAWQPLIDSPGALLRRSRRLSRPDRKMSCWWLRSLRSVWMRSLW